MNDMNWPSLPTNDGVLLLATIQSLFMSRNTRTLPLVARCTAAVHDKD